MKNIVILFLLLLISTFIYPAKASAQACCSGEDYFNLGTLGWLKATHYYQGKCVDSGTFRCLKLGDCWDSPDAQGLCIGGGAVSWFGTDGRICREKATYLFGQSPKMQCRPVNLNGVPPSYEPDYGQFCDTTAGDPTSHVCKNRPAIEDDDRAFSACDDYPDEICVSTPFGQIRANPGGFASQIIALGIGIGSGVAFLLIIFGTYVVQTSQGNPDGINHGKEIITSAIIGLVFIVLSVTIMQIIGFDLLGLGSFGLGAR